MVLFSRKCISALLAASLIFSTVGMVSAYSGVADWAEPEVGQMEQLQLIPDSLAEADFSQDISRLDMCRTAVLACEKLLGQALPLPEQHPFSDTQDPAAEKAYAAGLARGDGDGGFRPEDSLLRLEFFQFSLNLLESLQCVTEQQKNTDLSPFSDADSIPDWGVEAVKVNVAAGVVKGSGSSLDWADNTSRQEAMCMFLRSYQLADSLMTPEAPTEPTQPEAPDAPTAPPEPAPLIRLADWAKPRVGQLDHLGLIPDEVRATPMDGIITRENMCRVLIRSYQDLKALSDSALPMPQQNPFSDTSNPAVLAAHALGLVSGTGGGCFSPDSPITRQDFFVVCARFLKLLGSPQEDDPSIDLTARFQDADQIADYALAPIRLMVSTCKVQGSDGKLRPRDSIVCQEALSVFYEIYQLASGWIVPESDGAAIVETAKKYLGYPYAYGGRTPEEGFDCSGFVYYVYRQHGYDLKPGATNQWNHLPDRVIPQDQLRVGDLVFFSGNGEVSGMEHVGIYIGDGQMIHSGSPATGVVITPLSVSYYAKRYLGAKRPVK